MSVTVFILVISPGGFHQKSRIPRKKGKGRGGEVRRSGRTSREFLIPQVRGIYTVSGKKRPVAFLQ